MAVLPVACSYARPAGETRGERNGERRRAYYSCMVAGRGACSATCAVRVVAVLHGIGKRVCTNTPYNIVIDPRRYTRIYTTLLAISHL